MDTIFVLFLDTEETGPVLLGTFGSRESAEAQAQEDAWDDGLGNLDFYVREGDNSMSHTDDEGTSFVVISTTFVP
jgi:hypothetical protein